MIQHSEQVEHLFSSLHEAQKLLKGVPKDSVNPHFRNRYASLENVIDTAREPLLSNGLAFMQAPGAIVNGALEVTTMLVHTSGQWLSSTMHVPLSKNDAQGAGSATTYGCRYTLMALLGIPPVDDDGEGAIARQESQKAAAKPAGSAVSDAVRNRFIEATRSRISVWTGTQEALGEWWRNEIVKQIQDFGLTQDESNELKTMLIRKGKSLEGDIRMAG